MDADHLTAADSEQSDAMPTSELHTRLAEMEKSLRSQREERHRANNALQKVLSNMETAIRETDRGAQGSMLQVAQLNAKHDGLREDLIRLEKTVTEVVHVVSGVGGQDGMRQHVSNVVREQKELRALVTSEVEKLEALVRSETGKIGERVRYLDIRLAVIAAGMGGAGMGVWKLFQ